MGRYPHLTVFLKPPRLFRDSHFLKIISVFDRLKSRIRLWTPEMNEQAIRNDDITNRIWILDRMNNANHPAAEMTKKCPQR